MVSDPQKVGGTGWGLGGIGQAEWQYVPMSHILSLVGLKKDARQVLFWSGVDNKQNKPGADAHNSKQSERSGQGKISGHDGSCKLN